MRHILHNKKGVTLLEGLIAMALLALVAAGTFGVLLSVSHKAGRPDIREEMALAVEKASDQLQVFAQNQNNVELSIQAHKLCDTDSFDDPLQLGEHDIACLLPVICDRSGNKSTFKYTVSNSNTNFKSDNGGNKTYIADTNYINSATSVTHRRVDFNITCNGFAL